MLDINVLLLRCKLNGEYLFLPSLRANMAIVRITLITGYRLVLNSFKRVLAKRQSRYSRVLEWLDEQISAMRRKEGNMCARLHGVLHMKEFVDE
jgi:hypothetical protein